MMTEDSASLKSIVDDDSTSLKSILTLDFCKLQSFKLTTLGGAASTKPKKTEKATEIWGN